MACVFGVVDTSRLVYSLKDSYNQDGRNHELMHYDIAFKIPGGLDNLMLSSVNVGRALSDLVLTDVEHCVDNHPTDALISQSDELSMRSRMCSSLPWVEPVSAL